MVEFFVVVGFFRFGLVLGLFLVLLVWFGFAGRELVCLVISVTAAVGDRGGRRNIALLP